jgi:hypothetical protein
MAFKKSALVALLIVLVSAVFWLALFPPSTPRIFLNHRRAVQSIRSLSLAEHDFAANHPNVGFACSLGDLAQRGLESPSNARFVDTILASGTKSSYHFEIACPQSGIQKSTAYTITALPTEPGTTGQYALCTDQTGEIWYSENGSISDCFAKHKPIEQKYR